MNHVRQTAVTSRVMEYFIEIPNTKDFFKCMLCEEEKKLDATPKKPLNGKKKWNLKKHIQSKHKDLYDSVFSIEKKLSFATKRLEMVQNFCEIVTINGRPFKYLLDSGFKKLIANEMEALYDAGFGITLDKDLSELKEYIAHVAHEIKNKIAGQINGRFLSLMLDIASKNNRSVVGISAQYNENGKIKIHTLGMIVLEELHTAKYITKTVIECLEPYNVPITHIISMTTDNASTMLAMIKRFDDAVNDLNAPEDVDTDAIDLDIPSFENDGPLTEEQMQSIMHAVIDSAALNEVLDDQNDYENLFEEIIGEFSKNTTIVTTVRCGAHSIQLVVRHGINKSNFKTLLALCKFVSKKLRTEKYKFAARDNGIEYSNPHLSTEPRWDSDYLMVSGYCLHLICWS